jgi:precorrin-6Y C5,15-methyltransferase (decarboxylating)
VTCVPEQSSGLWSLGAGLPDDAYEHDGQLTKRDVRAAALAHLMPVPGQLLWDVGAGAGSVGIEWMRAHPRCRAVAVERDETRAARIRTNAARLGVPELQVVVASAPAALDDLPPPDAVFVGGGATRDTLELAWDALAGGGRLVVHAVTHETELVVSDLYRRIGGQLTRISVEQMAPIGSYSGWKPARAVVQWSAQKPLDQVNPQQQPTSQNQPTSQDQPSSQGQPNPVDQQSAVGHP